MPRTALEAQHLYEYLGADMRLHYPKVSPMSIALDMDLALYLSEPVEKK